MSNYNKYTDMGMRATESLCQSFSEVLDETPSKFPHIAMDFNFTNPKETLSNTEDARRLDIEFQIFTIGSIRQSEGMAIADLLFEKFRSNGFSRTYGPRKIPNYNNPQICRTVIRFRGIDCT